MPGYDISQYDVDVYDSVSSPATGVWTVGPVKVIATGGPVGVVITPPPGTVTAHPIPIVEIAFASNPWQSPIWVDVSRWVEAFSYNRGRNRERDQVFAGTMQMTLDNRDRRFDPTFSGSPYAGQILPMRKIRVRASYNNSIYSLFNGYVQSWGQEWSGWADATVPLTASDGFLPMNLAQLNTSYPAQTSDQRISAVLDTIGWTVGGSQWTLGDPVLGILGSTTVLGPTGDRSIGPGQAIIAASTLTNTAALQHIQDVTTSEFGMFFINHDGVATFFGRNRLVLAQQNQATFGEQELPYVSITMAYDDTDIWNDIRITASGGVTQVASDITSQAQYFKRTLAINTLQNSDPQALGLANLLLSRHKQPALQITSVTLDGDANPAAIYPQMLTRELADTVTAIRRPPGGGLAIVQPSTIQGINTSYSAEGGEWSTIWRLSPTDTSNYWLLGDVVQGLLGTSTRLFF